MRTLQTLILLFSGCHFAAVSAELVAHRGASVDAPENTVASTRLAFEQGAEGVECDILLTKDGRAAVIHDATTKRTTGVDGKVEAMTLEELQKLDAAAYFKDKKYAGEKIPALDELFAIIPDGRRLVVELKGGEELIPAIRTALEKAGKKPAQIEFISFKYKALAAVKKEFPQHKALLLCGYSKDKTTGKEKVTLDEVIAQCKAANLDGMSLSIAWPIDAAFVKKVKDAGLQLYIWTVNDAAKAKDYAAAGVEVICTDKPGFLRDAMK